MRLNIFKTRTFRTQLTATIALLIFCTIALVGVLANLFINQAFEKYAIEQQKAQIRVIATNLSRQYSDFTGGWQSEYVHGVGMAALYDGYVIHLTNADGNTVWDAENHDMKTCNEVMMEIINRMEKKRPGLSGSFATQEFELTQNGDRIGTLAVQSYGPYFLSESDFRLLDSLNIALAVIGGLALLCSVFIGGFLAKRISRPVMKTAQIATQIAEGNYAIRFEEEIQTRELDELVSAVNHMAASLETQEGLRKRLTTDVAHELRTPLTVVSSHLEAMMEGVWDATPQRLQGCYDELGRLSGLIADLERLAKVENENLKLEKTDVDLRQLTRTLIDNFETESAKKNLAVTLDAEESIISADKDRVYQVFQNLLSNAIKYTPENGRIHISVTNADNQAAVTVEDNGIGIPEQDLPFIFERFYRADKSRNRSTGGAGIGLTIAKSIIHAHGGTITAESVYGKGSRFTVVLPK